MPQHRFPVTVALGALIPLAATVPLPAAGQSLDEAWQRCENRNGSHRRDAVIAGCTQAIQAGRDTPANLAQAYVRRGAAHDEAGLFDQALADFAVAITLNPRDAFIFLNRGIAFKEGKEPERALRDFETALRLDPNFVSALRNRGTVLIEMGQVATGQADLDRARQLEAGAPR